ncbi:MAG: hypothetical protein ABSG69_17675 [Candidatus Acidiferrum sp.]
MKDLIPTLPQLRRLHYLISESEGKYIAHCLDLDLVSMDANLVSAGHKLDLLVKDHIEFSLATGQLANLNTKAPVHFWQEFSRASSIALEPKEIHITIPDAAQVVPLLSPAGVLAIDVRQLPHAA